MSKNIFVTKSSLPELSEYINEISDIWESHQLTNMGPKHNKLENLLKQYTGTDGLELFTNGHSALELGIQSLELSGEVITTPFTFASTTHAIVRNNLTPVFCDINIDDFTIDVNKIEDLITENTSAIIPVHVYGNICNINEIDKIAKKHNLKVLYDAAHAFGESLNNVNVANFGDISCFSFHATKVFNTIEGGAAMFKDESIGKKLYKLKNFGIASEETVDFIGANAKMNEFSAAMGICNLKHLHHEIDKRKFIYGLYMSKLKDIKQIRLPIQQKNVKSNYAYFPILINNMEGVNTRDKLYDYLKNNNIYARKYFYPLTSDFDCYKNQFDSRKTPVAKYVSERVLTLPLYSDLTEDEVTRICKLISKFFDIEKG